MIRPDGIAGVAFGEAADGDPRSDPEARRRFADAVGVSDGWAWLRQVHGARVVRASAPGLLGSADAAFTTTSGLPLVVATADCYPVVLIAEGGVGIAHAGWRGAAAGVVDALRVAMEQADLPPKLAAIGPGIGPCCFEVGPEVAAAFPDEAAGTSWGTPSVDLVASISRSLDGIEVWRSGMCTMSDSGFHSFRRDRTTARQGSVAWLAG